MVLAERVFSHFKVWLPWFCMFYQLIRNFFFLPLPLSLPFCLSHFSDLLDGLAAFRAFLRTEFSEENLEFWLACEDYKKIKSQSKMASKAKKIFAEYIAIQSCKEVSRNHMYNITLLSRPCPQALTLTLIT